MIESALGEHFYPSDYNISVILMGAIAAFLKFSSRHSYGLHTLCDFSKAAYEKRISDAKARSEPKRSTKRSSRLERSQAFFVIMP
jgi:hypothetical protein